MKSLMLIALLTAGTIAANAQTIARADQTVNGKIPVSETPAMPVVSGNNNNTRVVYTQDAMSFINMRVKDQWAYFDNIDGLGVIKVHVTNVSGREVFSRKLADKANAIDISKLSKGLYFITLISENTENRKAFTLNL